MQTVEAIGRGLLAGAIGTAALTLAEKAEMRLTGREASTVPGQVGAKLARRDPEESASLVARLNPIVHWSHGIGLGVVRALVDAAGLRPATATFVFYPIVWGGDAALYQALGIADVPWRCSGDELGADLLHKGVYAAVTGAVYDALR